MSGANSVETRKVPWVKIAVGAVAGVIALYLPYMNNPDNNVLFSQVLYLAIAAMGLNLLTGFNGQISIGHGAFFGVGAFTTAVLVVDHGWMLEWTIPVAALLAAALGVAVGFPALRVKGLYLALITLGLSVLFPRVAGKYFKGGGGVALIQPRRSQRSSLIDGMDPDIYRYYLCLALMVLLFVLAWNLIHSRAGRAMIAVRDQEVAASTVGVNVAGVKVGTFALSAAYAGVAGSLAVLVDGTAADATNPLIYFQRSIEFLIAVVIGGAATISGPLLGAAFLVFIRHRFEDTKALSPALLGGSLMVMIYLLPDGIVGGFRRLAERMRRTAGPVEPASPDTGPTTGPNQGLDPTPTS